MKGGAPPSRPGRHEAGLVVSLPRAEKDGRRGREQGPGPSFTSFAKEKHLAPDPGRVLLLTPLALTWFLIFTWNALRPVSLLGTPRVPFCIQLACYSPSELLPDFSRQQ